MNKCICCGNVMKGGKLRWHFKCTNCGYESGELIESINSPELHSNINEKDRETGLEKLRSNNFRLIIERLKRYNQNGESLLDVGCAHGWFLEISKKYFKVTGIEPDINIAEKALKKKLAVRTGFFPDVLSEDEKFDIITFNDVIEHIPDVRKVLLACHQHLNECGLLAVNIPVSDGFIYTISKVLMNSGIASFFNRMWQVGFPSPHLHYFNKKNFSMLVESYHFELCDSLKLKSITLSGLNQRIQHTGNYNKMKTFLILLSLIMLLPLLNLFKSDTSLFIYKKIS